MATFTNAHRLGGELLSPENRAKSVWVIDSNRLGIGPSAGKPTHVFDFASERVMPFASASTRAVANHVGRRTGRYSFELMGEVTECRSLKSLLIESLRAMERARPGMLDKLTTIKPRNRRIVARDPRDLFENENLLADIDNRATKLDDVWWVGTNNNEDQVRTWLARACECAGLAPGEDFKTSLTRSLDELIDDLGLAPDDLKL